MAEGHSFENPFQSYGTTILITQGSDDCDEEDIQLQGFIPHIGGASAYDIPSPLVQQLVSARTHTPGIHTPEDAGTHSYRSDGDAEVDDLGERIRQSASQMSDCLSDLTTAIDDPHLLYQQMLKSQGLDCPVQAYPNATGALIPTAQSQVHAVDSPPIHSGDHSMEGDSSDDEEDIFTAPAPSDNRTRIRDQGLQLRSASGTPTPRGRLSSSSSGKVLYDRSDAASPGKQSVGCSGAGSSKPRGLHFSVPSGLFSPGPELKSKGYRMFRESTGSASPHTPTNKSRGPSPSCDCECRKCGKRIGAGRQRSFFESLSLSPVVEGSHSEKSQCPAGRASPLSKAGVLPTTTGASVDDRLRIDKQQKRLCLVWLLVACLAAAVIVCAIALAIRHSEEYGADGNASGNNTSASPLLQANTPGVAAAVVSTNVTQIRCMSGWTAVHGKCLKLSTLPLNRSDALRACDRLGGALLVVRTEPQVRAFRLFSGINVWINAPAVPRLSEAGNTSQASKGGRKCSVLARQDAMFFISLDLCRNAKHYVCEQQAQ